MSFYCKGPTPVLNTPLFSQVFGQRDGKLQLDEKGHDIQSGTRRHRIYRAFV